jgi:hypothetical protein
MTTTSTNQGAGGPQGRRPALLGRYMAVSGFIRLQAPIVHLATCERWITCEETSIRPFGAVVGRPSAARLPGSILILSRNWAVGIHPPGREQGREHFNLKLKYAHLVN